MTRREQRSDTLRNKSHDVITHERLRKTTTPNTTNLGDRRSHDRELVLTKKKKKNVDFWSKFY